MLKELASDDEDVKLLTTIFGVGYYSALLTKSEIGVRVIDRFSSGERLCSYAGLVFSVRSSGIGQFMDQLQSKAQDA